MSEPEAFEKLVGYWREFVIRYGTEQGVMPAVVEFYDDRIAQGHHPRPAAISAFSDCEIIDILGEL